MITIMPVPVQPTQMTFELQPIMNLSEGRAIAHELLFRGEDHGDWCVVDRSMLTHLAHTKYPDNRLFVNLSNAALVHFPEHAFLRAALGNKIVFEISEALSDRVMYARLVKKVNQLMRQNIQFAIDDFGNGRDGLQRLYSFRSMSAVKIDAEFLKICMVRRTAAQTIMMLIERWQEEGILTIAEGVESSEILAFCQTIGVDCVQGWHVDKIVHAIPEVC